MILILATRETTHRNLDAEQSLDDDSPYPS